VAEAPLLVLDADGVFLDETPYWQAALVAALRRGGLQLPAAAERAFVATALATGLQRTTKQRGCNSNWDLAVVLATVIQRGAAAAALRKQRWPAACAELAAAVSALAGPAAAADPLGRFGLHRDDPRTIDTAAACEAALIEVVARDGWRCLGEPSAMRATLAALRGAGHRLGICSGRGRDDLFAALRATGLQAAFDADAIIDVDRIADAAAVAGTECRPKPHAFPLLAAALGVDDALAMLRGQQRPVPARVIYAGDGRADVETAAAARCAGLPVQYAHLVSPASDADTMAAAAAAPWCLGVFASLPELAASLLAVPR
jgi:phosphoglycolate phosphatase-like HAD superfamily hydrolase